MTGTLAPLAAALHNAPKHHRAALRHNASRSIKMPVTEKCLEQGRIEGRDRYV